MNKVYLVIGGDMIHHGHINIIKEASNYGPITIGLHTDQAILEYTDLPALTYDQRKAVIENIKGVEDVIPQNTLDYTENLNKLKPKTIIHGDDWKTSNERHIRNAVIEQIKAWDGQLIEVPYTQGISTSKLKDHYKVIGTTPQIRLSKLKRLLNAKPLIRIIEAHNGLTGLIAETTSEDGNSFDAMWSSSLTDSVSRGKPDIEAVDLTSRLTSLNDILEVTTKPIIFDGDTGGLPEHFIYTVKTLERLGISAIIIEDKCGLKRNSLHNDSKVTQTQESIPNFCHKIEAGKAAQFTEDFMIISRIESFIAGAGLEDALTRAKAYIDAGTDAIMIHSKEKNPDEIISFCNAYQKFDKKVPLVAVPTTYNSITEQELQELGINIVIYANHFLRSAYPAMMDTAKSILKHKRSHETNNACLPIKEILKLIPGT